MKKEGSVLAVILGLAFIILVPVAFFFGYKDTMSRMANGIEVECTVVGYQRMGRHVDVQVEYYDEKGNIITADCVYNDASPYIGEKITCYADPDDPYSVYRPLPLALTLIFGGVGLVFVILGISLIHGSISGGKGRKLLDAKGTYVEGEVFEVTMSKGPNGGMVYPSKIRFTDSDGADHVMKYVFDLRPPDIGDKRMICYAKKPNGKVVSELSDTKRRY